MRAMARTGWTSRCSSAATWQRALGTIGFEVETIAGDGPVDRRLPGLAIGAGEPPTDGELVDALADADLVVVENLCTIPLNLPAARAVARVRRDRPSLLHHHDPAWQQQKYAHVRELPPNDPAWRHVVINRLSQLQFAERGLDATLVYNGFDPDPPPGDRARTRAALRVATDERLLVHPVRAIARKNVPAAVALAEAIGATYWLVGQAEDGYEPALRRALDAAKCRVIEGNAPDTMHDVYAAADAVAFPSTWEGFGNPPIEASLHRKPVAIGTYPVARELEALGFQWFDASCPADLDRFLAASDHALLDHNQRIARQHFSLDRMADRLHAVLDAAGWLP